MVDFYASVAADYDRMTRFSERLKSEAPLLQHWTHLPKGSRILDVACGTGLHAILLAGQGFCVTASDLSTEMLSKAKANAQDESCQIEFVQSSMETIGQRELGPFEAIFCLGNSIPHLLTPDSLNETLQGFHHLLAPGGIVLLQLLNYEKILLQKERIIAIHRTPKIEFIRFYDFTTPTLSFNILTITNGEPKPTHSLVSTELYPYQKDDLCRALTQAGFSATESFGSLYRETFDAKHSPNLILRAKKC